MVALIPFMILGQSAAAEENEAKARKGKARIHERSIRTREPRAELEPILISAPDVVKCIC